MQVVGPGQTVRHIKFNILKNFMLISLYKTFYKSCLDDCRNFGGKYLENILVTDNGQASCCFICGCDINLHVAENAAGFVAG